MNGWSTPALLAAIFTGIAGILHTTERWLHRGNILDMRRIPDDADITDEVDRGMAAINQLLEEHSR